MAKMVNTVRLRLTLWYVLVFGSLLMLFSIFVYLGLSKTLYYQFDRSLSHSGEIMATALVIEMRENNGNAPGGAAEAIREVVIPDVYTAYYDGEQLLACNYPENQLPVLPADLLQTLKSQRRAITTIAGFGEDGARLIAIPMESYGREYRV